MNSILSSIRLTLRNGMRYLPLLENLVSRELKRKYRSSFLGYVWCILSPLLVMVIMTLVFSQMFNSSISNYPVYLFTGRMLYVFATGGAGVIMKSIVNNGALMRKTRVPYYMFPLSSFFSCFVDFLFNLVAFAIVLLFTASPISFHIIAFPLVVLQACAFTLGLGLILALANVRFRDTNYLYLALTTAWIYLTPIFYPVTALPEQIYRLISTWNPLYYYIAQTRSIFLDLTWPDPVMMLRGTVAGLLFLALGLIFYSRTKDDLILYI